MRGEVQNLFCYLCGPERLLPSFVCVQMSVPHSALCGVDFEQRQVRKPSTEEEEEETKGLHDERKGFYSKGKSIFWNAFLRQVIFLYCHLKKKVPSNQDYAFMQLTSLYTTFQRSHCLYEIIKLTPFSVNVEN